MRKNPYTSIKNNTVLTASPEELTLMLYDGAIKFANQAVFAIEADDMKLAHEKIFRVERIIEELRITLNHNYPIAGELDRIYEYIYRRLVEANTRKDIEILDEIMGHLRGIRDSWKEAMVIAKRTKVEAKLS